MPLSITEASEQEKTTSTEGHDVKDGMYFQVFRFVIKFAGLISSAVFDVSVP